MWSPAVRQGSGRRLDAVQASATVAKTFTLPAQLCERRPIFNSAEHNVNAAFIFGCEANVAVL